MASGDTKTEAMLNVLGNGGDAAAYRGCCNTKTQNYILDAIDRVQAVEDEVERLENNPDVVDIVATYADLEAYDTSELTDKDIIRVLEDSTHNNNSTYYRWNSATNQFDFVGEISGGSSVNVVQTTGTSTTDVMSQNATSSMVFADPGTNMTIQIGASASASGEGVSIGRRAIGYSGGVAIGRTAGLGGTSANEYRTCIGYEAGQNPSSNEKGSISLGAYSKASATGEMNIGSTKTTYGYNNTNYRLLTGLYDPQSAHDAATKGYVDAHAGGVTPVQSTGTSTTDVMSQKAVTSMICNDPTYIKNIQIGKSSSAGFDGVAIGYKADASNYAIAIGGGADLSTLYGPRATGPQSMAFGINAQATARSAISFGGLADTQGVMNVGTQGDGNGYNSTNYRLISGVYDGQTAQDAVTVNQVNSVIDSINTALSTNIPHIGATS